MTADRIRSFDSITKEDVAIVGGKGANLGEMSRAGFPVPEGFVIAALRSCARHENTTRL